MDIIQQRTEASGKPRYIGVNAITDGGGNIFIGMAQTRGVNTAFTRNVLVVKLATNGQVSVVDEREIPDDGMADGVGITQSGRQLHVFAGAHIGDPTARLYHYALDVCVPYPEGQHVGMEGAYEPIGGEPVVEIDYDRIQAMVDGNAANVTNAIKPQVVQAMARALDKSKYDEDEAVRSYQDRLFKRADDDLYLILNKLITGHDPNHPVENEPFKKLIKKLVGEVLDERL